MVLVAELQTTPENLQTTNPAHQEEGTCSHKTSPWWICGGCFYNYKNGIRFDLSSHFPLFGGRKDHLFGEKRPTHRAEAVKVPVLATGGIGDPKTAAAALVLGASAVQVPGPFLGASFLYLRVAYPLASLVSNPLYAFLRGYILLLGRGV